MASLQDFIVSRVRVKLLKQFLIDPAEMYYVRQLTRKTGEEINAIRRELQKLEKIGFLNSEKRGNRLYYYPNKSYDFYPDMINLVAKTTGLGLAIRQKRNKIGKIKFAVMSGKYARRAERDENDVDLLVVGTIIVPELGQIIQAEEKDRGAEINYTVMTMDEFQFRKDRRDPFLLGILSQSRIMLIGDEQDLIQKPKENKDT